MSDPQVYRHEHLAHEPMRTLVDWIQEMAAVMFQITGRRTITGITLSADVAINCGILPGQQMQLATPVGYVVIASEFRSGLMPRLDHDPGDEDRR